MKEIEKNAIQLANYLNKHSKVSKVFHPALPDFYNHNIWKRDFSGSSGLFSFSLDKDYSNKKPLFGIGVELEKNHYKFLLRNIKDNENLITSSYNKKIIPIYGGIHHENTTMNVEINSELLCWTRTFINYSSCYTYLLTC